MAFKKRYTREELLASLRKFVEINGRIPAALKDFKNNPEYPSWNTIANEFGSWNNALTEAGLTINVKMTSASLKDEELLDYLKTFEKINGRPPAIRDFVNNVEYPSFTMYQKQFGSWDNAMAKAGFVVDNATRRGRKSELDVYSSFEKEGAVDLSVENQHSLIDGMCPNKKLYDVKSSKLHYRSGYFWIFNHLTKEQVSKADYFFSDAYDKNHGKLLHRWRVPKEFIRNRKSIVIYQIHQRDRNGHDIENMKVYEIELTDDTKVAMVDGEK